jgi:glycosyltransferase involved in cell wall biosynthesis
VDDRPLKIEMVLPTLEVGGMEVMAARLSRALAERGHDVGLTCVECGGVLADELLAEGYRVAVVPAPGLRSNARAPHLESWLQTIRPDVVHVHSGVWLKAARAARHAGASRVVHTLHGVFEREPWYAGTVRRWAARHTDGIVAVSESLRDYLIRDVKVDRAKVRVIVNGVNTARFRPGPRTGALRRPLRIDDGRLVIGNVARLDPIKNHALLLEAFALVRAQVPEATLVLVGEGPLREELESHARALELYQHVHFPGTLDDVAAAYRDFDLFVLPSRIEGTSMSILEAMASGVAVITTAVGGSPELLAQGRCGMLVPPDDPAALATAMIAALRDGARRRRLAAMAREHVTARYGEDMMLREYEALYRGDTSRSPTPHELMTMSGQCVG